MRTAILAAAFALSAPAPGADRQAVLPVTADVGITSTRGKELYSNGAGPTCDLRQNQNWSGFENKSLLLAFDCGAIRGWSVSKANLKITLARGDLYGVGLCTVLAPWSEGSGMNWALAPGAACWDFARCPRPGAEPAAEDYWAWRGADIAGVCWAHPQARTSHAGPAQLGRAPAADKRFTVLTVPVDPRLVEALAIGAAHGLALTDDKGQVTESFALYGPGRPYRSDESQNPWVFTRDVQDERLRPVLEVWGEPIDKTPPGAPGNVKVTETRPTEGAVVLAFDAPGDDGAKGTALAYRVVESDRPVDEANWNGARPLPRWSLPLPVAGGARQRLPLFTLSPGARHLGIRAVDEAGNAGPVAAVTVNVPQPPPAEFVAPKAAPAAPRAAGKAPAVFVCPDTVKIDPVSGAVLRDGVGYAHRPGYAAANEIWRADRKRIMLTAAANETVAFKVILTRGGEPIRSARVQVSELTGPGGAIAAECAGCFRLWYIKTGAPPAPPSGPGELDDPVRRPSGWHGDACLPLAAPFEETFDVPAPDNRVPDQRFQAVWVDLYVPRDAKAGRYDGKVRVTAAGGIEPVELNLEVNVLPVRLPDTISWRVDLNRYGEVSQHTRVRGTPAEVVERRYYQLAQQHRATINALPYGQSGGVYAGFAPGMKGEGTDISVADWSAFDKRWGPLLDGTAFSRQAGYVGPGADTPVSHIYLPFCEAWPVPLSKEVYADYAKLSTREVFGRWSMTSRRLEEAFSDEYKAAYVRVAREFFEHFRQKGWTGTAFQAFYNNKYYFKVAYFGGGFHKTGSSFWLLDEPVDFDDYDANRFFLSLVRRGHAAADAPQVKVEYRTDISQPEMTRGLWAGVADVWCCSAMFRFAPTAAVRRQWLEGENYWHYGGGPADSAAAVAMIRHFLRSWCAGTTGEIPYWNFGGSNWTRSDNLSTIYTGANYAGSGKNYPGPVAGARLKLIRRAQQDIEYLHLLAGCRDWDRARVRAAVSRYADDPSAPILTFNQLSLDKWIELRNALAATIQANR